MQRCIRCVMNETDPNINFNEEGICNHCLEFDSISKKLNAEKSKLDNIIQEIKNQGKNKKYDCVLGVSGGVDSSYLLHYAVSKGLKVLAIHIDAGWNSEIAVRNIHNICKKLNVDLDTYVIDWPTMRELQRAYLFSGVANLDIPQDHAFIAGNYKAAIKNKINYLLVGTNFVNESVSPKWGYDNIDFKSLKSIFKTHKRLGNLKKYPHFSVLKYIYFRLKVKRVQMLDLIDYSKRDALNILEKEYDYKYYGGKHYESRFTKFFQSYYLPVKFGYDKRLIHLSNLILNKEITRDEALTVLEKPAFDREIEREIDYVLEKLNISKDEWNQIMNSSIKTEQDYKNNARLINSIMGLSKKISRGEKN